MAKIIDFKAVKTETNHKRTPVTNERCVERIIKPICCSPIKVERTSLSTISVGFRIDCFNLTLVDAMMKRIAYMQNHWRLSLISSEHQLFQPQYKTYVIRLLKELSEKDRRATFRQILIQISEESYTNEISVWGKETEVEDLIHPHNYVWADGVTISKTTAELLRKAGIGNGTDLIRTTREEICQIPGMTTKEVYRLEKSLASRGLFLRTAEPDEWQESEFLLAEA